jgi:16S rRNA processing protein RimM
MARRILLGRIGRAHGVRGEVSVATFTAAPESIGDYGPLSDETGQRRFDLKIVRVTPKGVIVRIAGVADRTAVEALNGTALYVDRERLPPPAEGEYYHEDLIGLAAVTVDGAALGEVVAVQNYGAGDLLEVRLSGQSQTELIPFTDACVPTINFAAGQVTIIPLIFADDDDDGVEADPS